MVASRSDMYQLSQDATFQNRVQESLIAACVAIANEGFAIPFHRERETYAAEVLAAPANFVNLYADTVATDANCIADATQAGTVVLTTSNRAAQAALVTDAHIDAAIASEFNAFIREPAN